MAEKINNGEFLIVQGVQYATNFTRKYRNRKSWKMPNLNLIYSFIPGTVIDVLVKQGQTVKQGETLMILDAMKMHNNVLMPFDGEVVKINVGPKDRVAKNHPMMEIRPR
jgi:pyruvate carboxylase